MGSRLEQKSSLVRKRIEGHTFDDEGGDEYEGSKFGGFPEYFRRKKIKLQNKDADLRAKSKEIPPIFKGVVCHVNGYTQPSLNDLHTMTVQYGGGFIQYLDGKTMVTHIIASNLTPKKKEEFRRYRIVKPAWIVDSIAAGKLLPWDAYRVVDEGVGQRVLGFDNGQVVSQAAKRAQGYREQTETSWYTSQLRSQGSQKKPPKLVQTITPSDDIEDDDDYGLPEITSSIEQALDDSEQSVYPREPSEPRVSTSSSAAAVSALQTPPPSSQPPEAVTDSETIEGPDEVAVTAADAPQSDAGPALQPRQGSQEPDFSHKVVRDSAVFKNISPTKLAGMTAEEHNALLLSDPNIRKSTVVHPDFLEQYYRESRLHHLSTWKADLKSQLQALAAKQTASQKAQPKKVPGQRRYIMHVDFDSFFAAVSLKKHPQYKDKPAVVAHGGGSGSEIASCNYPARKFGISNGMWMKRAQQLCPELKILPYDFPGYEAASRIFYDAIMATGGVVQSVSIDEALVDISAICIAESGSNGVQRNEGAVHREQAKADEFGQKIRDEVLTKTGCAVSVGIGANILQAKVALRKAKPAGQYQLKPEDVLDFIGQLEVTKLPGVAYSIGGKLEDIGVKLVKDILEITKEKLINTLGPKTGEKVWEYARGIDKTEVGDQVTRKSVSAEVNWGVRFENQDQADEFLRNLSAELCKRLLKEHAKGSHLNLKIMKRAADAPLDPPKHLGHGKCDTFNKGLQLGMATNDPAVIAKETVAALRSMSISPGELRGIGMQMSKLVPIKQGSDGIDQASQRKLQFKVGQPAETVEEKPPSLPTRPSADDPIQDDVQTPEKQRIPSANQPSAVFRPVDPGTPTKNPLNIFGTQFILPSQVDPAVLAELPDDIRAKLIKHTTPSNDKKASEAIRQSEPKTASRAQSPAGFVPPQSQLDPSILEALPQDVRAEVLGFYTSPSNRAEKRGEQALLPQSPRKLRTLPPLRQAPPKRGRGRPRGSKNISSLSRNPARDSEASTLTQSNFVARPQRPDETTGTDTEPEAEELDPEVLAALPEDLRQEVIAQQRQARLQRTGGIDLSLHQHAKNARRKKGEVVGPLDRCFTLPARPAMPTFTANKLTDISGLRNTISAWFREFNDEGPYVEDVDALIKYLSDVVIEEHDLGKAVAVVKWMNWVIDDAEDVSDDVITAWKEASMRTRNSVQDAADARQLGKVKFD
ncbi:DNA repair protein rev1 [Fulvia fulva]|nr:DNA repair protein rev1 [Fulvia fulva]KAK4614485.1 DNA repair protein rev1 [Fulvia fulva]WPV20666.1 DNA repair protein rev1 [Fulvia fulva]WPV35410.1 DNA repair protein rev1 [Fulvia fulva]